MRTRRNVCPRCLYNGNRHLCGCMADLGNAIETGDLALARELFEEIVRSANAEEQERRSAHADLR